MVLEGTFWAGFATAVVVWLGVGYFFGDVIEKWIDEKTAALEDKLDKNDD